METLELNTLRKTELKIENINFDHANLTDIAAAVADTLGIDRKEVFVTDLRGNNMTLDILKDCIDAYKLVGKKGELLKKLSEIPGVSVTPETNFSSDGVLGWIANDDPEVMEAIERSKGMAEQISNNIMKRAVVFSSGSEVEEKQIVDTNTPFISKRLEKEGYNVTKGTTLEDDKWMISSKLREAAESGGYGLIITTGGVGAEDKDHTVEAVLSLDKNAATPYICHFEKGTGRHVKDGVKIAVGEYNGSLIVSLPGPNDEVKASMDILTKGLKEDIGKSVLAERLAANLRNIWRSKVEKGDHHLHKYGH